jgi:Zn-dependent protease
VSGVDPYEPRTAPEPENYSPVKPQLGPVDLLKRLAAPLAVALGVLIKFGGSLKFLGIFVAVGGYALIWGWAFAVGFVLLILVHEVGHFVEAKRQGLNPSLPVFIPFLGAYVAIKGAPFDPWRNGLVSIAGPIAGAGAAAGTLVAAELMDSRFLFALAYAGFFLNLINLAPFAILDGGFIARSWRLLRAGAGAATPEVARRKGYVLGGLYLGLAALLVVGMVAAHVPQDRL